MNHVTFAHSGAPDSGEAGRNLASQLEKGLNGKAAQAVLLFASSSYDYAQILKPLDEQLHPSHLLGCSSAGEFVSVDLAEGQCCALAISSDEMHFSSGMASGLSSDPRATARQLCDQMTGLHSSRSDYGFRTALVFCDALAGNTEELIEELTRLTAGQYQLVGGGAGDDGKFSQTSVFYRQQATSDAVVMLEMLSRRPLGIGVSHGWQPTGRPMRVTEATGMKLVSVNAEPAANLFAAYAAQTGQSLDRAQPVPFFLHNVVGIKSPLGWKLRVPLSIDEQGAIHCASEIPQGSTISFMKATAESSARAAEQAIHSALAQLGDDRPEAALFFDCVATRLRLGSGFGLELETIKSALGNASFGGYNTYGQIARSEGQFSGFHNCTAVVCVIPR